MLEVCCYGIDDGTNIVRFHQSMRGEYLRYLDQ